MSLIRDTPRSTFRALKHRNYRLFFTGQTISLIGTWMQQVALSWLVYHLTNSAFLLGFLGFIGQLPAFLVSPFAGVLADRWNRHGMVIATQVFAMLQATILAVLTLTGLISVWQLVVLSGFLGLINAFDIPTRQAFLHEMIDNREDLGNAIALNSSMFNGARLIGPSIAGVLIAAIGEGLCFLLNAFSYIAVLISLFAMKLPVREKSLTPPKKVFAELREGVRYSVGSLPIRSILLLMALVSVMGMSYAVLMPIVAKDILHGGPHTLGFLMAVTGTGALTGALMLASRKSILGLGRWIAMAATLFGAALVVFSVSHTFWLSMVSLYFAGLGMMVTMTSSNTILQTLAEDKFRGRVMSLYTMSFSGMVPFGSLLAGTLASRIGTPTTLLINGIAVLCGAAFFARNLPAIRVAARPVYEERGILPVPRVNQQRVM